MSQISQVHGNHNLIIQAEGDHISIQLGSPYLTLTRYQASRQPRLDIQQLSPYSRFTPLLGRDSELASLHAWLNAAPPLGWRVIIASGGAGKTRLALELCEQAAAQGWDAGFVSSRELQRFGQQQNLSAWGWQRPTLIVVDYAAQRHAELAHWLDELADQPSPAAHPLRILLLERHADTDNGWFAELFSKDWHGLHRREGLDPTEPIHLSALTTLADRIALLKAMLPAEMSLPENDPGFTQKLMELSWGGDPLFLMMAALTMGTHGCAQALTLGRTDLANTIASEEQQRLCKLAKSWQVDESLLCHLMAGVCLAQGMPRDVFEQYADAEKTALRRPSGGDAGVLADLLAEAWPDGQGGIAPILPDLIAEAFILNHLQRGEHAVLRCYQQAGPAVIESLVRCVLDFQQAAEKNAEKKLAQGLAWLETLGDALAGDEAALETLDAALPMESVTLRAFNLGIARKLYAYAQTASPAKRASRANHLAIALSYAGEREIACERAQEAVGLYRQLAAQRPEVFQAELATSLNTLANMLRALGQHEAACESAQEAVELCRQLAAQRPEVFQADLAMSLNNLAAMLSDLGQHKTACERAQEAVELYHQLAAQRPEVFQAYLATSLSTLANMLRALGQHEAACERAQEAVELYRQLAAQRPEVFQADLAASLSNLANMLRALGQHEAACEREQEAVKRYRQLAAQRPEVFQADLAMSLNNLAAMLSDLDQHEAACESAQEAVELRRQLAAQRPEVFQADLAMSLNNLAAMLSALGQHEVACKSAQEAVELYRQLAAQRPEVFQAGLAMSLNNLANRLRALGQHEAACARAQEAIELYRQLAAQRPEVFQAGLARSLIVLALCTEHADSPLAAVGVVREAVATLSPAFIRYPAAHGGLLTAMLQDYLRLCDLAEQQADVDLLMPLLPYLTSEEQD